MGFLWVWERWLFVGGKGVAGGGAEMQPGGYGLAVYAMVWADILFDNPFFLHIVQCVCF